MAEFIEELEKLSPNRCSNCNFHFEGNICPECQTIYKDNSIDVDPEFDYRIANNIDTKRIYGY